MKINFYSKSKIKHILILLAIIFIGLISYFGWKSFNKKDTLAEVYNMLPTPGCEAYAGDDKKAKNDAVVNGDLTSCLCIKDEDLKAQCEIQAKNNALYSVAIDNCSLKTCEMLSDKDRVSTCLNELRVEMSSMTNEEKAECYEKGGDYENSVKESILNIEKYGGAPEEMQGYAKRIIMNASKNGKFDNEYFTKVESILEESYSKGLSSLEYHRTKGFYYKVAGRYEEAENEYNECLKIDEDYSSCKIGLAHLNFMEGDLAKSVKMLGKIEEDNKYLDQIKCIVYSKDLDSYYDKAINSCNATAYNKENSAFVRANAYSILANMYLKTGRKAEALKYLETANYIDINNPYILKDIAFYYIAENDLENAEYYINQSIELNSYDSKAYYYLGFILFKQNKDLEEAINKVNKGLEVLGNDFSVNNSSKENLKEDLYNLLISLYEEMGDEEKVNEIKGKVAEKGEIFVKKALALAEEPREEGGSGLEDPDDEEEDPDDEEEDPDDEEEDPDDEEEDPDEEDGGFDDEDSCFPAGTKISMADGSKKQIEEIEVGEEVKAYDFERDKIVNEIVLEIEKPIRNHMCNIEIEGGDIFQLTKEHPFYTNNGWRAISANDARKETPGLLVNDLIKGDKIKTEEGSYKEIKKFNCREEIVQTYNLKRVGNKNNFYANGFLVHNKIEVHGTCFPEGTKILMADGSKKSIEKVKVGEKVKSYDFKNDKIVNERVIETENPVSDNMCKIQFETGDIFELTKNHPLYTNNGWKSISVEDTRKEIPGLIVGFLKKGDKVKMKNGTYNKVEDFNCKEKFIQTYNLKRVGNKNNFYANGFLVHNKFLQQDRNPGGERRGGEDPGEEEDPDDEDRYDEERLLSEIDYLYEQTNAEILDERFRSLEDQREYLEHLQEVYVNSYDDEEYRDNGERLLSEIDYLYEQTNAEILDERFTSFRAQREYLENLMDLYVDAYDEEETFYNYSYSGDRNRGSLPSNCGEIVYERRAVSRWVNKDYHWNGDGTCTTEDGREIEVTYQERKGKIICNNNSSPYVRWGLWSEAPASEPILRVVCARASAGDGVELLPEGAEIQENEEGNLVIIEDSSEEAERMTDEEACKEKYNGSGSLNNGYCYDGEAQSNCENNDGCTFVFKTGKAQGECHCVVGEEGGSQELVTENCPFESPYVDPTGITDDECVALCDGFGMVVKHRCYDRRAQINCEGSEANPTGCTFVFNRNLMQGECDCSTQDQNNQQEVTIGTHPVQYKGYVDSFYQKQKQRDFSLKEETDICKNQYKGNGIWKDDYCYDSRIKKQCEAIGGDYLHIPYVGRMTEGINCLIEGQKKIYSSVNENSPASIRKDGNLEKLSQLTPKFYNKQENNWVIKKALAEEERIALNGARCPARTGSGLNTSGLITSEGAVTCEECDAGPEGSDDCYGINDGIMAGLLKTNRCGDGVLQKELGEVCDPKDPESAARCDDNCQSADPVCGDGFKAGCESGEGNCVNGICEKSGRKCEICDDGENLQTGICNADCTMFTSCGDGVKQTINGEGIKEQCDCGAPFNSDAFEKWDNYYKGAWPLLKEKCEGKRNGGDAYCNEYCAETKDSGWRESNVVE